MTPAVAVAAALSLHSYVLTVPTTTTYSGAPRYANRRILTATSLPPSTAKKPC